MWRVCTDYIYRATGRSVVLSEMDVLFGYKPQQMKKCDIRIINHFILLAKMVISKFKYGTATDICLLFEKEVTIRHSLCTYL